MENAKLPESFYCPLTLALMVDPVIDPEGNSYERSAIMNWLKTNNTSPLTRTPLTSDMLVPNRALKDIIEQTRKDLGIVHDLPPSLATIPASSKPILLSDDTPASISPSGMTLSVTGAQVGNTSEYDILVTVKAPVVTTRTPVDVICVVDVSGSMGESASIQTSNGQRENHGLTQLDVVKHALKTIVSALQPDDRLAVVKYSDDASDVVRIRYVTEGAKNEMLKSVGSLRTEGSTNIWAGLKRGLEIAAQNSVPGRMSTVLLLTDGVPTTSPPQGEAKSLKKYRAERPDLLCAVNTFGFGYGINSELLREMAIAGDGMYVFIPDAAFVGTAFVSVLSNVLSTAAIDAKLTLTTEPDCLFAKQEYMPNVDVHDHNTIADVSLGSVQFGQTRDFVIRVQIPKSIADSGKPYVTAQFRCWERDARQKTVLKVQGSTLDGGSEVAIQNFRQRFVCVVMSINGTSSANQKKVEALIEDLESSQIEDERLKDLIKDIKGQVTQAVSRGDWYQKWGAHYLPSLVRAHLLQQCNNFKDPGIQHYGGDLFNLLRDEIDQIFVKLPPPKPSVKTMATYHNRSAPCFHGSCTVSMADGSLKLVKDIKKGDALISNGGKVARVLGVVKTVFPENETNLVNLDGGLIITPYHPVRVEGKWYFPKDLAPVVKMPCEAVYSFALESDHIMIINGVECVTLGHNFQDDPVVAHPYFGSQLIIEDLEKIPGWSEGLVEFTAGCMIRDTKTGLVSGLRYESLFNLGA